MVQAAVAERLQQALERVQILESVPPARPVLLALQPVVVLQRPVLPVLV